MFCVVLYRKPVESEDDSEEGEVTDGEYHPLVTVTKIKADEIPEVPPNRCVIAFVINHTHTKHKHIV